MSPPSDARSAARGARPAARVATVAAGLVLALAGCARPAPVDLAIGHHRVRLVPPPGWEHLDHGREQLFRHGEATLTIEDLGPATPKGMEFELSAARQVWRAGRVRDAFEQVRNVRGPSLVFATSDRRAAYWVPWNEVARLDEPRDTFAVARAFEGLIENTRALDEVAPEGMVRYVLQARNERAGRSLAWESRRIVRGAGWIDAQTWSTVSHQLVRRLACTDNAGYLLVVTLERDPLENAQPAFEALLGSIELLPGTAPGR